MPQALVFIGFARHCCNLSSPRLTGKSRVQAAHWGAPTGAILNVFKLLYKVSQSTCLMIYG